MLRTSKLAALTLGMCILLTACKKKVEEVTVTLLSVTLVEDEIEVVAHVDVDPDKYSCDERGILYGTTTDLVNDGTKIPLGSENGEFSGIIDDFAFSTLYYVQAYAMLDGVEYLSDISPVTTLSGWAEISSIPGETLHDLAISPDGTVHVVGSSGAHFYSADGGINWNQVTHINSYNLWKIKFIDENVALMMAGSDIRKSTDGGMNWTDVPAPTIWAGDGVFFYDANTFFTTHDDTIYSTTDAGANWFSAGIDLPGSGSDIEAIYFISADIGFALSWDGAVLKSMDGGLSWNVITSSPIYGTGSHFWAINENILVAGLSEYIFLSTDGGDTWDNTFGPEGYITEIYFCDDQVGMVGTAEGELARTTGGGLQWTKEYFPYNNYDIEDVELLNPGLGYAIDDESRILKFF